MFFAGGKRVQGFAYAETYGRLKNTYKCMHLHALYLRHRIAVMRISIEARHTQTPVPAPLWRLATNVTKHFALLRPIYSMKHLQKALAFVREYFFPFGCPLCGAGLITAQEAWYGLCDQCRASLDSELNGWLEGPTCRCCGKPLISEHDRCLSCRNSEPGACDQVKVLFPYSGKYRDLLAAYKFGRNTVLKNFFAEKITTVLMHYGFPMEIHREARQETRIVPVPPRPGKIKNTGWDQVESIVRHLEGKSCGPFRVNRCLKRLPSKSQKELSGENRRTNLKGRIVIRRQPPKTAVLLDDVMTTGSTLDVCAAALKAGGTETVYGICLFVARV